MTPSVIWTSGATDDYFSADERLAPTSEIERIVQLIRVFPEMGSPESERVRRVLVGRSRIYGLYYSTDGQRIIGLALIDLRQDPFAIESSLRQRGIPS